MLLAWLGTCGAWAQGMPGGGVGYNAVVAKLLGDFPAFSASVETAMANKEDQSKLSVPMVMSKRGDILRIEVDLAKMKGTGVSLEQVTAMQNIGLGTMAMLVNPNERVMTVLFPTVKFATQVGMSAGDVMDPRVKVGKRQTGKDKIAGQATLKQQITLTGPDGRKSEATTWENPALNNFPVRIAFKQEGTSVEMTFTGTTLTSGPDEQYSIPGDYRQFNGMPALMEEARKKVVGNR